jgi:hypothetical protein
MHTNYNHDKVPTFIQTCLHCFRVVNTVCRENNHFREWIVALENCNGTANCELLIISIYLNLKIILRV